MLACHISNLVTYQLVWSRDLKMLLTMMLQDTLSNTLRLPFFLLSLLAISFSIPGEFSCLFKLCGLVLGRLGCSFGLSVVLPSSLTTRLSHYKHQGDLPNLRAMVSSVFAPGCHNEFRYEAVLHILVASSGHRV